MAQSLLGMRLVLHSNKRSPSLWGPRSPRALLRRSRVLGFTGAALLAALLLVLLVRSFTTGKVPQESSEGNEFQGQTREGTKGQLHENRIEEKFQEHSEGHTQNKQEQTQEENSRGTKPEHAEELTEGQQGQGQEQGQGQGHGQEQGQEKQSQGENRQQGDEKESENEHLEGKLEESNLGGTSAEGARPEKVEQNSGGEGSKMSSEGALGYFSKVLLVVTFEREHNEAGRVVVPLLHSIYSRVFPHLHFVSQGHTLSSNTKRPRNRPAMEKDHLQSLNYGVLADLPFEHGGEDLEGILWMSCTTVLNYWNFNGANKELLWFPSFKDGPWSLVGPETKGGWLEDQIWQEKLKITLDRLDPEAKGCLNANLASLGLTQGHPDTADDFAAKGPDQIFYVPKRHFANMQLLAGAFHGAGIPAEVAVPSMLLALETPLNTDPILDSAIHLREIAPFAHLSAAKSAYQSNKPAFWPWPFEGKGSLKEMVSRMAEGDSSLRAIADGIPSGM